MDEKPAKRRAVPVSTAASERKLWLVKVPAFVSANWQSLPFLQERSSARARLEPVLEVVLSPLVLCAPASQPFQPRC